MKKYDSAQQGSEESPLDDWNQLLGYEEDRRQLHRLLLSGRFPQVILFTGREGLGKAQFLNLVSSMFFCFSNNACGSCESCRRVIHGEHPDILMTSSDKGRIKLDQAVQVQEHLKLHTGMKEISPLARRVALIPDADLLSTQAGNRLLKIIEEPPEDAVILLSTSRVKNILPTLRSRAVTWTIQPPPLKESIKFLNSHFANKATASPGIHELENALTQKGLAPGLVIRYFENESHAKLGGQEQDAGGLFESSSYSAVLELAEKISKNWGWSTESLLQDSERQLNARYRSYFQSSAQGEFAGNKPSPALIYKRRVLLSELRTLAVREKISINTQLAAERIGLLNVIDQTEN